ncbi:MAG: hypothetical protein ACTIMB_04420 [Brachybacterium alimentarium]
MAYRFNPPPNWPIDDANWSPPPGWQPDPSWGPAPEGWNFWVTSDLADDTADDTASTEPDVTPEPADAGNDDAEEPVETSPLEDSSTDDALEPRAAETDEYLGPDLEADLAQAAPYESAKSAQSAQSAQSAPPVPPETPVQDQSYGPGQGYDQQYQDYGQASPAPAYGTGYPSSPAYGQSPAEGLPSADSGENWTATTASGEPPRKGVVARFWWLGCIVLFLVAALVVAVVGGILLLGGDGNAEEETTTAQEQIATEEEAATEAEGSEPASPEPTTPLPTIDPSAEPKQVTGENGSGEVAVSMEWKKAEDLPSAYGGTVQPAENGEYLVMTAEVTVTEGSMSFANYAFSVKTPYGGSVDSATETYALDESGLDYDSSYEFTEGETYTITVLFDFVKAGGNTLQYNNYVDVYSWDVPA